ncbi:MAG: nitrilase-related carbon-nitrogen hydrolase [Fimbriimonadales bacterium]
MLLALALPPGDQWWLGPACLAPLLSAVAGQGLIRGFVAGILAPAVTALVVQSNLLYHVRGDQGGSQWVWVGCGFFGFLIAILSSVASESKLAGWRRVLLLGSLAVVLEFALFPILPAHLALTQYRSGGMLVVAGIGGIWLVSLLLWLANAAFAEALQRVGNGPAIAMLAILAGVYGLAFLPRGQTGALARVAAIQTDSTDTKSLEKLNGEAGRRGAELAVWPEFSGMEIAPPGKTEGLRNLSAEPGQAAFVTTFRDTFRPLPHNTAALFHRGTESAWYFKRKVFGGEVNMHTPGTRGIAVPWPGHPNLGLDICYDSCYPRMIAETASLPDVGLIAHPTIDPDATNCFIAAVHEAFTPFRAAEQGVAIVRADGIAHSAIVDNAGKIVAESGPRSETILVGDVRLSRRWTLYSLLGDWVLYLCGAWVLWEIGRWFFAIRSPAAKPS